MVEYELHEGGGVGAGSMSEGSLGIQAEDIKNKVEIEIYIMSTSTVRFGLSHHFFCLYNVEVLPTILPSSHF